MNCYNSTSDLSTHIGVKVKIDNPKFQSQKVAGFTSIIIPINANQGKGSALNIAKQIQKKINQEYQGKLFGDTAFVDTTLRDEVLVHIRPNAKVLENVNKKTSFLSDSFEPTDLSVEELRAQEIQEFRDTVNNADSFITDGRIDSKKVKASEDALAKEIYNKYDKLISPLLNPKNNLTGNVKKPSYNTQKEYYLAKNVKTLLEDIVNFTEDADTRVLAQSFLKIPNIDKVPLKVTKYTEELKGAIEESKSVLGQYNSFSELVTIIGNLPKSTFETVFLHELVHSVTVNEYYSNAEFSTKIDKLYNYALKFKDYRTSKGVTLGEMYGMKNAKEFMSEAISNPSFIFELSKYYSPAQEQLKEKNIFQEFIDLVVTAIKNNLETKGKKYIENNLGTTVLNTVANYSKLSPGFFNSTSRIEKENFEDPNEDPISEGYQGYDSFMPATMNQSTGITYDNIVYFKEVQLSKIQERIAQMQSDSAFDKSTEHKKQIAELKKIEEDIKSQIANMLDDPNIFEMKLSVLNPDIELVEKILESPKPTLENLKIAVESVEYFRNISDYSSANKENNLVNTTDPNLIDPIIKDTLNKLNDKVRVFNELIYQAKINYLRDYINKSESIKELYFKGQVKASISEEETNEIVKDILGDIADLSFVDTWFNALGSEMNVGGQESLLVQMIKKTLSDKRNVEKSRAAGLTQAISDIEDRAKRKLNSLGFLGIFKGQPYTSWDLYYQKDANGNKTGRLIGKYSDKWDRALRSFMSQNNAEFNEAMKAKDYKTAAAKKAEKFSWINGNAEFLNISLVPEIANAPRYKVKFPGNLTTNSAEADFYKKEVINKIGQFEYDKLVKEQIDLLEGFMQYVETELDALMDSLNVSDINDIPAEDLVSFNIGVTVRNPFLVLKSKREHQGGRVDFVAGNSSVQYQSLVSFNSFFPKKEVARVNPNTDEVIDQDTGYFDAQYENIAQDSDLLKLWEDLSEAAYYINEGLNDSEQRLSHNSLWEMKKSMLEVLFSKDVVNMGKPMGLFRETGQIFKNLFTEKESNIDPKDQEKITKPIQSIDGVVKERLDMFVYKLSIAQNKQISFSTKLKRKNLTPATIDLIETITQKSIDDLLPNANSPFRILDLKGYISDQVMQEQSFDLPTMVKAYLDIISEYRAKKASVNEVTMMQGLYKTIKRKNTKQTENEEGERKQKQILRGLLSSPFLAGNRSTDISKERVNAQTRLDYWINKQVKGLEDKTWQVKLGSKTYTREEKKYKQGLEEYKAFLESNLEETDNENEQEKTQAEINDIQHILDNLGQYYTLNAVAETVVNRLNVALGLTFNPPAQIVNRVQGWFSGMINDTGRYWTAGNFNVANAFINRKSLRHFGKLGLPVAQEYANQIKITRLLVEKMAILQDATNELDRASRSTGATRVIDVLKPYGLTQYVEWHNQVPQILSILMDIDIKDSEGNVIKVFSGSDFPAFNIEEGRVSLKPEFDTPENQETWVTMTNQEANRIKDRATNTIALLNGDYSKLGSTYIKKYFLGRFFMTFKTWLPTQISLRFGENQRNLALGLNNFDGAYTGALKNKKTAVAGTAGILGLGIIGGVTTGIALPISVGLAGALSIGLITRGIINRNKSDRAELDTINAGRQLVAMGKALVMKTAGLPINAITGKNLVPNYTFKNLSEKETDRQNLMFIINELTGTLYYLLTKVLLAAAWSAIGGGDDDELKEDIIPGTTTKTDNLYYDGARKNNISIAQEQIYIGLENQITQIIGTAILYTDPVDMATTMLDPKGLTKFFDNTDNVFKTYIKAKYLGEEVTLQGPNRGEDKFATDFGKKFLPVLANEILIKKDFKGGFASKIEKEWEKDELIDIWFKNSDYARDVRTYKSDRAKEIRKLEDEIWDKDYVKERYEEIESASIKKQFEEYVKTEATKAIDESFMRPSRSLYDENQERLDLEKLKK